MPKGKVKWFNQTKGYGFIAPEEGDKDVFVHITAVRDSGMQNLEEDQEVEFELVAVSYTHLTLPTKRIV